MIDSNLNNMHFKPKEEHEQHGPWDLLSRKPEVTALYHFDRISTWHPENMLEKQKHC